MLNTQGQRESPARNQGRVMVLDCSIGNGGDEKSVRVKWEIRKWHSEQNPASIPVRGTQRSWLVDSGESHKQQRTETE